MLKSVRVPEEGPLTDQQREQIRETVRSHLKEHGITRLELCRQVAYGESTLSEVLKNTYKAANCDVILRKLNGWLDDDARRRARSQPLGFYSTSIFLTIRALAVFAKGNARIAGSARKDDVQQESARIAVGWGPAGCGKSIGARALAAEDPLSILIRLKTGSFSGTGLAKLICESAGWRGGWKGASLIDFVFQKLQDSGRLLIVDEGHRLRFNGCEFLRDLADVCGIPILILATREFYDKLAKIRTTGGGMNYAQFTRRVGYVCDLTRGEDGKGGTKRPIFSEDEVRAIFRADSVRVLPDALDVLQAIACTEIAGMLGEAFNVFDLAVRSVIRTTKVIDAGVIWKATKRVMMPAGEQHDGLLRAIEAKLQDIRQFKGGRMSAAAAG